MLRAFNLASNLKRRCNSAKRCYLLQSRGFSRNPLTPALHTKTMRHLSQIPQRQQIFHSWIPTDDKEKLKTIAKESMVHKLTQLHLGTAYELVEWFTANMPAAYFRQTDEHTQLEHMKAISALWKQPSNISLTLNSFHEDGRREITFINSTELDSAGTTKGLLRNQLKLLPPADGSLSQVKIYSSLDQRLAVNTYTFTPGLLDKEGHFVFPKKKTTTLDELYILQQYLRDLKAGKYEGIAGHPEYSEEVFSEEAVSEYLTRVEEKYPRSVAPSRFCQQMKMFRQVQGTQGVEVSLQEKDAQDIEAFSNDVEGNDRRWITLAVKNLLSKVALEQATQLLALYDMDIQRVHLDHVDDGEHGMATMLRVMVDHAPNEPGKVLTEEDWGGLVSQLKRMKWVDDDAIKVGFQGTHPIGVIDAEIIVALANMLHGPLSKQNPWAYSRASIMQSLTQTRYQVHAKAIAKLFRARFDPEDPLSDPMAFKERKQQVYEALSQDIEDEQALTLFQTMLKAVEATYRTNLYMPNRYGLSLRVDPSILQAPGETRELPFGVFFVHGRRFNGFHCRFRDIARGGVRLVSPQTSEQLSIESSRTYDEAYGLSSAQQLKNKDIPEGGSKAVVLVNTANLEANAKFFALRKSFKAFTDGLLDLITETREAKEKVVDYFGRPELLYLGPDEQVIPEDINWVVQRAAQRDHPVPAAFMSSKPDTGINHKEYGVTSEGVFVFLDVALQNMGLNPRAKDSFTVKITGGPDGDVAGNIMKIMHREYGKNTKVVGVSDGFGCAEDPDGLNWQELLRLVHESKPISEFNQNALGPQGALYLVDNEEGIKKRNTMHNRVKSDVFIPSGGRPGTIHKGNYKAFLLPDGTPSSNLIVEAANLFVTQEARDLLYQDAGIKIVKDSSANKCGVITSSYEIAAAMLCSEDDFTKNKEEIVNDVLQKLHHFAALEAELLFREHQNTKEALPQLSQRISLAINRLHDAIADALEKESLSDILPESQAKFMPLVLEHLPKKLVEIAGSPEEVQQRLPVAYLRNVMASSLSNRIVYNEGIEFIESQSDDLLAKLAFSYLDEAGTIKELIAVIQEDSSLADPAKRKITKILQKAGIKASLNV